MAPARLSLTIAPRFQSRHKSWWLLAFLCVGGLARGQETETPAAESGARDAQPAAKAAAPRGRARRTVVRREREAPPVCAGHPREAAVPRPRENPGLRSPQLFPGQRMMEGMMRDMNDAMARSPATGFRDVLSAREREAIATVRLSVTEERRIGESFRERYLKAAADRGYRLKQDDRSLAYLRDLVRTFHQRMRHRDRYPQIEVLLLDATPADGQAFPGGTLVFTTGLLKSADEATVAGVVAHELAHLDLGHVFEYAKRAKLADSGFADATDFESMMTRGMAVGSIMMNPYRPEHELEADCQAATWLYQEGYDPRALVRFFERIHREQRDQPDSPVFAFNRSHPYSLDRRAHVLDRVAQLRRWKPRNDLGLFPENLQRRKTRRAELAAPHDDEP